MQYTAIYHDVLKNRQHITSHVVFQEVYGWKSCPIGSTSPRQMEFLPSPYCLAFSPFRFIVSTSIDTSQPRTTPLSAKTLSTNSCVPAATSATPSCSTAGPAGAKRRKEAICKATELIGPMLKRALAAGVQARYLLMDSWFGMPPSSARPASTFM